MINLALHDLIFGMFQHNVQGEASNRLLGEFYGLQ